MFHLVRFNLMVMLFSVIVLPAFGSPTLEKSPVQPNGPNWELDLAHGTGSVEFDADVKPGFFKIHGVGSAPHGEITDHDGVVKGELNFNLDSLDTGIKQRNDHMKEKYLETKKFPESKFTIESLELPKNFLKLEKATLPVAFIGKLLLHGVEKPVKGIAQIVLNGTQVDISSQFPVQLESFNIAPPKFAGVSVSNEVHVTIKDHATIVKK